LWLFFVTVGIWALNRYLLPGLFQLGSVAGNIVLLAFAALAGWCLIRRKKITLAVSTVVFVIFILSLWLAGSMSYKPGESVSLKALGTLGYVDWVPAEDIEKAGVTVHDANGACEGVNLFCFRRTSKALLMDNDGRMLHVWVTGGENMTWHHVRLCRNGDLIGGMYLGLLSRLDWYSNIKWVEPMHFHHSIALGENEQIYVLDSRFELVFYYGLPVPILNDYVVTMSPDGKIKRRIDLYGALKHQMPFEKVLDIFRYSANPINTYKLIKAGLTRNTAFFCDIAFDALHNNTITLIDRDIKGLCRKNDLLISPRELDLIGIIDSDSGKLVWSWGRGEISGQHQPCLLDNDHIVLLDNGRNRDYSRVVEVDPLENRIAWQYKANPPTDFHCPIGGSIQPLQNGNILITDESKGRVFEITRTTRVVWEFYSPQVKGTERATIYYMTRITNPQDYPKLAELLAQRHETSPEGR